MPITKIKHKRQILAIMLCAVLLAGSARADEVYVIEPGSDKYFPGNCSSFLEDPTGKMTFEEVKSAPFHQSTTRHYSWGYGKSAYWIKLKLKNRTNVNDWRLLSSLPFHDRLDYYERNEGGAWRHIQTGRDYPFRSRGSIEHTGFTFPLQFDTDRTKIIYIRIQGSGPRSVPLELIREEALDLKFQYENLFYGLYFGFLFLMILYNTFIFSFIGDHRFWIYNAMILCTLVIFSSSSGYLFKYIHPNHPWLHNYSATLFMGLIVFFTSWFPAIFLEIKKYSKLLHYVFRVQMVNALIAIWLTVSGILPSATNSLVSLQSVLMIVVGVVALMGGNKAARFYLIGWSAYVIGGLFVTLRNSGKIMPTDLVTHAVEIGSMLEVLFLSIALSDKYGQLRLEKQRATKKALEVQKKANEELEQKVKDRTAALEAGNHALDRALKELQAQNDHIVSSINYAERIQKAIMPSANTLAQSLSDVFVFFRPRDIVSGDFYWVLRREEKTVVAVADCTGHGVPGAMMSMMGLNLLERIYVENLAQAPNLVLQKMDGYVADSLSVGETRVRDGMDIGICVIDHQTKKLVFSGAKMSLLKVTNGVAERYKSSSQSLGGEARLDMDKIPQIELDYTPDDTFYLYSDGFRDQFGGEAKRKYLNLPFRNLLARISALPLAAQKEKLGEELDTWMKAGDQKQTDDVVVLGFKP